ncbi:hypothetical protein predicted by Glimmer/Critica [Acetobacter ghanensis]|uniref:Secreted protein n=2 Tax=Acetobacter ghanensis TaxID=431306 RepID=A0A0U5BL47_9PROT|nr:hypothetical protein predicted by Glimmer/Critica [Acetobacter ghanensis]
MKQRLFVMASCLFLAPFALSLTAHRAEAAPETRSPYSANDGESTLCVSGPVYIIDVHVVVTINGVERTISTASSEVCSVNPANFSDVVVQGPPPPAGAPIEVSNKVGVEGTIRLNGRTAVLETNVYLPAKGGNSPQCAGGQGGDGSSSCKSHSLGVNLAKTWIFSRNTWRDFYVGPDDNGDPVKVLVRLSDGPVN